jgi:5-formyltetrahydrofolate cyclo-ligase
MDIRAEKEAIRKQIFERRQEIDPTEKAVWDAAVANRILALLPENTRVVCAYVSVRGETGTEELIRKLRAMHIRVALPRVIPGPERRMRFFIPRRETDLEISRFGIPEPRTSEEELGDPSCPVIVPGVAFSDRGARIGYGAGYYDRFLQREPAHMTMACAYDFQVLRESEHPVFSADPRDIRMQRLITPTRLLTF